MIRLRLETAMQLCTLETERQFASQ